MATMCFAMVLQQTDLAATNRLIMIFIGLIAGAMLVLAIALIVVALKAVQAVKGLSATAEEIKAKVLPLLDVATDIGKSGRAMLEDAAPKLKVITTNLAETSDTLKATSKTAQSVVEHCDATIADVNLRAQKQVARVDGMVTAALTTTAEVVESIGNGLRVPAQKIAAMASQAKYAAEGLLAKFKSMASTRTPRQPPAA